MATKTTFTKKVEGKVPYHFICNYCGRRNDKVEIISADASQAIRGAYYGKAEGSPMDMRLGIAAENNWLKEVESRIDKIRD